MSQSLKLLATYPRQVAQREGQAWLPFNLLRALSTVANHSRALHVERQAALFVCILYSLCRFKSVVKAD